MVNGFSLPVFKGPRLSFFPPRNFVMGGLLFSALLSIFLLFACSKEPRLDTSSPEALSARAAEYWQHRISLDFEKTYAMEEPESLRGASLSQYMRSFGSGAKWKEASVHSLKLKEDPSTAYVTMKIRYSWVFPNAREADPPTIESQLVDNWILRDNLWYHVFKWPFGNIPEAQDPSSKGSDKSNDKPSNPIAPGEPAPEGDGDK
ncbi:hypothetical protein TRIP_B200128 [uncultured Desulfatiglans sp.]|uniref:Uncharacterized protein n=1 Tax=Uncultured Desulfatiglans sp. TaxID=1748965 RepID=A0A653A212_UNCDX|nr:hypothetical protein TRIP_B200128 [uncultured Desulfatiglans sp.]